MRPDLLRYCWGPGSWVKCRVKLRSRATRPAYQPGGVARKIRPRLLDDAAGPDEAGRTRRRKSPHGLASTRWPTGCR